MNEPAAEIAPAAATRLRGDDKRAFVRTLFDRLAPRYDRLNLLISLGQTTWWRKRALARLELRPGARVLDVGCGTGWVVQYLRRRYAGLQLEGMDLSPGMLAEARRLDPQGTYFEADVCNIDRPTGHYDLVCTVFTSRNFPDLTASVAEMMRIVAPGGRLLVLDSFPAPSGSPWALLQSVWMDRIVPILVRPFADPDAYGYLAASIRNHVAADELAELCRQHGAATVEVDHYSFGSASRVLATKSA
ncbi:MAG: class I SAM-dependent methyltransferase [Myxococcales bacterium]|nr:class I SAM-dependent methyltransferase [Myxococcales bacterium]MCB9530305.1 class I SAM-dependent methyltransferase [Myxococcales bacterium]